MGKPLIIGITGGSGSGKSTVTREIVNSLPKENIAIIEQDDYYKAQHGLSFEERTKINYDHPNAFDIDLMVKHLKMLLSGQSIEKPAYDFTIHDRSEETVTVHSRDIIILEGIMLFQEPEIRDLIDIKIFVDADPDIRIIRRITRDLKERGRSYESIVNQYLSVVRPMHLQFIEPSKKFADIIIPEGGFNRIAVDIIAAKILSTIEKSS